MKGSIVNLMDANVHIKIKKFFSEHFKSDQTEDFKCKKNVERDVYLDMNLNNIY